MTTQDFIKGIDLTALSEIGATQLEQLVEAATPASETGMIVETTDTAADTPVVPDPNTAINGITPTKWKRYIWRRIPYGGVSGVKNYCWDAGVTSDVILLKWVRVDKDIETALSDASDAATDATEALNTAVASAAQSASAESLAQLASDNASNAQADADTAINSLAALTEQLSVKGYFTGDIRATCASTTYSTTTDEGWLLCDGSLVSRTVYAALFAALGDGAIFGAGDGSTTFKLPDFRGRVLIGAGTGAGGLTARVLGTNYGLESKQLEEQHIPLHDHGITNGAGVWRVGGSDGQGHPAGGDGSTVAWEDFGQASPTAIDLLQPSTAIRFLIKT